MKKILKVVFYLILFVGGCFLVEGLMSRQEQFECYQWQGYAEEFEDFYLVEWQAKQCKHHGIKINAPIKKK